MIFNENKVQIDANNFWKAQLNIWGKQGNLIWLFFMFSTALVLILSVGLFISHSEKQENKKR